MLIQTGIVPSFQSLAQDAGIQFRLARKDPNGNCTTGIDRIVSPLTYNADDNSKLNYWPHNKYLNVWVVSTIGTTGVAGYAYLPGTAPSNSVDGVLILSEYIGSIGTGSALTSRALTHEIGHFFNLKHPWGSTNNPGVACGDDNVADTPITEGWTSCNLSGDICTPNVIENVQNYMDYSYCSKMFTNGQCNRMRAALTSNTGGRNNLWTVANLAATGTDGNYNTVCVPVSDFNSSGQAVCAGGSINYSWLSTGGHPTTWSWNFPGGTPATSPDSFPTVVYNTAGVYNVSLTVSNGSGGNTLTKTSYITVFPTTATYSSWQWMESFENVASIPNADWTVNNPDNNATWHTVNNVGYTGVYSMSLTNSTAISGQIDEAVGPAVDMTAINSPILYFEIAYAQRTSTDNDRLQVFASSNCEQTWNLRYNKSGINLKTDNPTTSPYFPNGSISWRKETVGLPYSSATNLRLKFVFTSGGGNNIYIDNINITSSATGINELENVMGINIFPNPMNGSSTISFKLDEKANVKIDLFDVLGRNISPIVNTELSSGDHQYTINKGSLGAGIYFVKFDVGGKSLTKKVVIE